MTEKTPEQQEKSQEQKDAEFDRLVAHRLKLGLLFALGFGGLGYGAYSYLDSKGELHRHVPATCKRIEDRDSFWEDASGYKVWHRGEVYLCQDDSVLQGIAEAHRFSPRDGVKIR